MKNKNNKDNINMLKAIMNQTKVLATLDTQLIRTQKVE